MIITQPNDFVREVHDRMPVLLEERQFEPWLRGGGWTGEFEAAAERFSAKVASVKTSE